MLAPPWPPVSLPCSPGSCSELGCFFDHVPPPKVADDTDPNSVDHTCNVAGTCSEPPGLVPDYRQLGFRVPTVVVSPCDFEDVNDTADGDIPGPATFVPQACGGPVTGF